MYRCFTDLDFWWAMQGGLKMLPIRLDSIESTQIVSPVVDLSCQKSIARRESIRIKSRHNVRIKSNRKVPQTNHLSLGVLDMDVAAWITGAWAMGQRWWRRTTSRNMAAIQLILSLAVLDYSVYL